MNYTVLSRHSTAGPTFTDRPSDIGANMVRSKNRPSNEHHHLNPSKSKVNVRTFLNKSGDNFSLSNPNLDSVKGSGFLGNPPKAPQNVERDGYCE